MREVGGNGNRRALRQRQDQGHQRMQRKWPTRLFHSTFRSLNHSRVESFP